VLAHALVAGGKRPSAPHCWNLPVMRPSSAEPDPTRAPALQVGLSFLRHVLTLSITSDFEFFS
jgi:hypothetical protein